ncbi:SRPBCC family protein [Pseudarthrobacter sp. Y6]|uniref:SRPBCC family protein n=1 Tax=Pseudarthrobacter sp. Y6 TaxID=3418422 RepID=UPI003CE9D940
MVRSVETVTVARNTDEVFRFVADLRNEPKWHTDVDSVPPGTDAVPVVGKTYPLKFKPFMGATHGTLTAIEVEPGARVVYRGEFAGLKPLITYTIQTAGKGTRFTRSVEMRPTGLKMLMTPVMALMVPRNNKAVVQNLKRELES